MPYAFVLLAFFIAGCVAPPAAQNESPASQLVSDVPAGRVRIRFEPFDCFCHIAGVEQSLLGLPTVTGLDWDVTEYRVTLSVNDPPPTDAQVDDALLYSGVKIARIERP